MTSAYRRVDRDGQIEMFVMREPIGGDPARGYRGDSHRQRRGAEEHVTWNIDGTARTYTDRRDLVLSGERVKREEQRTSDGAVTRRISVDGRRWPERRFEPGASFMPPPMEEIIYGWVARGENSVVLVDAASLLGPSTHSELLRALPPAEGRTRVRVQLDYWPAGQILEFDDSKGEMTALETLDERFEKVTP